MLAKCLNPSCSASFHHLGEGRLFLLENDPPLGTNKSRSSEYFWLCKKCSTVITPRLTKDGGVVTIGLKESLGAGFRVVPATTHREHGLLLRSINLFPGNPFRKQTDRPSELSIVPQNWEQSDEVVAAASNCPMPDCGSLVIGYRAESSIRRSPPEEWEFTCSRCGIEFTAAQGGLLFQSVPKQWLSANIEVA